MHGRTRYTVPPFSRRERAGWHASTSWLLLLMTLVLGGVLLPAVLALSPLAGATIALPRIPLISQYSGQPSAEVDCGPASVAMVVDYFHHRPAGLSNGAFVTQVRDATGAGQPVAGVYPLTSASDLWAGLHTYGLGAIPISRFFVPEPDVQMFAMRAALAAGHPVIAMVYGADLGRGPDYRGHWVVVTGFVGDRTVLVNDPDTHTPPGSIPGGRIALDSSQFARTVQDAANHLSGPYGLVIYPLPVPDAASQPHTASSSLSPPGIATTTNACAPSDMPRWRWRSARQ
jgi:hypothetical protein